MRLQLCQHRPGFLSGRQSEVTNMGPTQALGTFCSPEPHRIEPHPEYVVTRHQGVISPCHLLTPTGSLICFYSRPVTGRFWKIPAQKWLRTWDRHLRACSSSLEPRPTDSVPSTRLVQVCATKPTQTNGLLRGNSYLMRPTFSIHPRG